MRAAAEQMRKLPYYHSFAHKSHPAVIDLAERLVTMAPKGLAKVQFTNSGSEANDTAIKLIWYYNNARGRPQKKKIISRQRAYHGITIASASLTGLPLNHRDFDLPLPNFVHVSCPHHWRFGQPGESEEAFASRLAEELDETIVREGPDTVAAFVGEPLMGAGGVIVPPRTYWEKIQAGAAQARRAAARRRGHQRFRPHRQALRLRDLRHHARHDGALQADHLILCAAWPRS